MPRLLLCFALTLFSFSLFAQSAAATAETPKITNIRKLLNLTGSGKLGVQVIQTMLNNYKTTYTNVDPSFWDEVLKETRPEDLVNIMIPVYDRNFTDEEIEGMVAFYSSPLGQKVLVKLPAVMQESMQVGRAWGEEIGKKVQLKLQQKGYIKEG